MLIAIMFVIVFTKRWNVALVGVGHLGAALLAYEVFKKHGFDIIAGLDVDKSKVGRKFHEVAIRDMSELKEVISEKGDVSFTK